VGEVNQSNEPIKGCWDMKVRITYDFDDADRETIAQEYGTAGKAGHAALIRWAEVSLRGEIETTRRKVQPRPEATSE
jgi:hypothetical protein